MTTTRRHDLLPARCQARLLATHMVCRDRLDTSRTWAADRTKLRVEVGRHGGRAVHRSQVEHMVRPETSAAEPLDVVWAVETGTEPGVRDRGLRRLERDAPGERRMWLRRVRPGDTIVSHLAIEGTLPVPVADAARLGARWPVELRIVVHLSDMDAAGVAVGPHPVEVREASLDQVELCVSPEALFELGVDCMVHAFGSSAARPPTSATLAEEIALLRAGLVVERQWLERSRDARVPGIGADELRRALARVEAGECVVATAPQLLGAVRYLEQGHDDAARARLAAQIIESTRRELLERLASMACGRLPQRMVSTARVDGVSRAGVVAVEPWRGCRTEGLTALLSTLCPDQAARR